MERMISGAKPTTYIHETQMNTENNAPVKNMIARMISGAKPTTYKHESQMNTYDCAPVQKHNCKND
jgi:transcriptional regulatory protein LevR